MGTKDNRHTVNTIGAVHEPTQHSTALALQCCDARAIVFR